MQVLSHDNKPTEHKYTFFVVEENLIGKLEIKLPRALKIIKKENSKIKRIFLFNERPKPWVVFENVLYHRWKYIPFTGMDAGMLRRHCEKCMLGNLFVSQFRRKPRMEDQKRTLDSEVFCIGIFAQKCLRQRPVVFQIGQNSNFRCFDLFDG